MIADEDLHRHAAENLARADTLIFGRITYEMMEAAWRPLARTGVRPDWMEPFARTIDAAKKYVVSSTLDRVDWNAELVRGDRLEKAVQQLKRESGKGLLAGGASLRRWADRMICKTDKIRIAWATGDRIGALRIAARFFDRSADTQTFKRGMDAHNNPDFYRQLGKEPEQITQDATETLANRFRLPFR